MGTVAARLPFEPLFHDVPSDCVPIIRRALRDGWHPAPRLPNFGINYDVTSEAELKRKAATMPAERLAQYADLVCMCIASDPDLGRCFWLDPNESVDKGIAAYTDDEDARAGHMFHNIANVARVSLFAPTSEQRVLHSAILREWQERLRPTLPLGRRPRQDE